MKLKIKCHGEKVKHNLVTSKWLKTLVTSQITKEK